MSVLSGDFLSTQNLLNVGVQAAVTAILAFGVTFVIVSGGHRPVGRLGRRAVRHRPRAGSPTTEGLPVWLAVLLAVATGIACGLVNGVLIAYGKLPPFIATLAMLSVGARPVAGHLARAARSRFPTSVATVGDTLGGWLPVPVLVMVVMGAASRPVSSAAPTAAARCTRSAATRRPPGCPASG